MSANPGGGDYLKPEEDHRCWARPGALVCAICGAEEPPPWPVTAATCRHCGHRGTPDEDHTCPCPHSDASCPDHHESPSEATMSNEHATIEALRAEVAEWRGKYEAVVEHNRQLIVERREALDDAATLSDKLAARATVRHNLDPTQ